MDQASLFIAAGICAAALALTILSAWFSSRADIFLVGWTLGMLLLAVGVLGYHLMPTDNMRLVALAFGTELAGFMVIYCAARKFTGHRTSRQTLVILLATIPPVVVPTLAGYDGLGIAIYNFMAAALLVATGLHYWKARAEAPSAITAMSAIYVLSALSFFACGVVLIQQRQLVLHAPPANWAEQINAIACIAGITGIGALSLSLNNLRAARRHREEARTDPLTGLLNRRALFSMMETRPLRAGSAVIVFDLDHFKSINDRFGHAAGDEVLRCFGSIMRENIREGDIAARTGGEEFVLVLHHASPKVATAVADRIRMLCALSAMQTPSGRLSATVSAGIAFAANDSASFDEVLHRADASLYRAKDNGRDRVVLDEDYQAVA